jgi:hypothetical protein
LLRHAGLELDGAADVGRCHYFRSRRIHQRHLLLENRGRQLIMHDVVHARAPAAQVGLWQFTEYNAGNRRDQVPRRLPDLLSVRQVAGVLVGHRYRHRIFRAAHADFV